YAVLCKSDRPAKIPVSVRQLQRGSVAAQPIRPAGGLLHSQNNESRRIPRRNAGKRREFRKCRKLSDSCRSAKLALGRAPVCIQGTENRVAVEATRCAPRLAPASSLASNSAR